MTYLGLQTGLKSDTNACMMAALLACGFTVLRAVPADFFLAFLVLIVFFVGVPHTGEVAYVWGYPLLQYNPAVRNDSQIFTDSTEWTEEDVSYTVYMQTLWTNFVKFA